MNTRQVETTDRGSIQRIVAALRMTCVVLGVIVSCSPVHAQHGGDTGPKTRSWVTEQEQQQTRAQVQTIRQRADEVRRHAESQFAASTAACYDKFLVSSCLHDAEQARIKSVQEARKLDLQAGDIERDLDRRLRADDQYRRAQREAEKSEQASRARAERDTELQGDAARQADRQRQAEQSGVQEQQRRHQRDAERAQARAARVAEAHKRAEATRQQRAEIDRKVAEHAKKQAERDAAAQPLEQPK